MAVIKEAKIRILSIIENLDEAGLAEGDAERTEIACVGYFHCFDDGFLITYAEEQEGARVTTEIKYADGGVRVLRRGAIESDMSFGDGLVHSSLYTVGPYKFDAEITTKRIRCNLSSDGGKLDLIYNMKIGGAGKNARMSIEVVPS